MISAINTEVLTSDTNFTVGEVNYKFLYGTYKECCDDYGRHSINEYLDDISHMEGNGIYIKISGDTPPTDMNVILTKELDKYEQENPHFVRSKFDDVQVLHVVFEVMGRMGRVNPVKEKEDSYDEGKLSVEYKTPVGTIGCPFCGSIHHGAITSPICPWCGKNIFSETIKPKEVTAEFLDTIKLYENNKIFAYENNGNLYVLVQTHNRASEYGFACITKADESIQYISFATNAITNAMKYEKVFMLDDIKQISTLIK